MTTCETRDRRLVWLIARDVDGHTIDQIQVTGPDAGTEGRQSGVDMGAGELREMWHARRRREETSLVGVPGAVPGPEQVEVRRWTMRLVTHATDESTWEEVERRLWTLVSPTVMGRRTGYFVIRYQERNGEGREITVRRTGAPEPDSNMYAGQRGHEAWTFEVTAYDPWWYGDPIVRRWEPGGTASTVLSMPRLGDQLLYLRWIFPAADTDATWTVPDGEGTYPIGHEKEGQRIVHTLPTIEAGHMAEATQRPDKLPFRIHGAPMSFGLMKQSRFTNPIEPGIGEVELPMSVEATAGDAAVEVQMVPTYERPHS